MKYFWFLTRKTEFHFEKHFFVFLHPENAYLIEVLSHEF